MQAILQIKKGRRGGEGGEEGREGRRGGRGGEVGVQMLFPSGVVDPVGTSIVGPLTPEKNS